MLNALVTCLYSLFIHKLLQPIISYYWWEGSSILAGGILYVTNYYLAFNKLDNNIFQKAGNRVFAILY